MTTALLFIDVQRNMLEGSTPVPAATEVRRALESLLTRAREARAVIIHVRNDGDAGDPDEPGTPGWELVFPPAAGELVVGKTQPDAFSADPGLRSALAAHRVDRIVVAGMQSNHCVVATSRGALRHGFSVELASGAHATYDEDNPAAAISAGVEADLASDGVTVTPAAQIAFSG